MPKRKRSAFNFDKTIGGVNVTERGAQSFSKQFKLGRFSLTLNGRKSGLRASLAIRGTGFSKRNIKIL